MHPHPAPDRLAAVDPKSGGMRMPCRSDGSQGSNDMDIESDDIEVSDSVTVLWEVRTILYYFSSEPFNFSHTF